MQMTTSEVQQAEGIDVAITHHFPDPIFVSQQL
jgi:hypothetical protein